MKKTPMLFGPEIRVSWGDDFVLKGRPLLRKDGQTQTWNGWLMPAFNKENIERYRDYYEASPDSEFLCRATWDGDDLVVADSEGDERVEPVVVDGEPRWMLGNGWTWKAVRS